MIKLSSQDVYHKTQVNYLINILLLFLYKYKHLRKSTIPNCDIRNSHNDSTANFEISKHLEIKMKINK